MLPSPHVALRLQGSIASSARQYAATSWRRTLAAFGLRPAFRPVWMLILRLPFVGAPWEFVGTTPTSTIYPGGYATVEARNR